MQGAGLMRGPPIQRRQIPIGIGGAQSLGAVHGKGPDRAAERLALAADHHRRIEPVNRLRRQRDAPPATNGAVDAQVMLEEMRNVGWVPGRVKGPVQPVAQAQELCIGKQRWGQIPRLVIPRLVPTRLKIAGLKITGLKITGLIIVGAKQPRLNRRRGAGGPGGRGRGLHPARQPRQIAKQPPRQGSAHRGRALSRPVTLGGVKHPAPHPKAARPDHPHLGAPAHGGDHLTGFGRQRDHEPRMTRAQPQSGQIAAIDIGWGLRQKRAAHIQPDLHAAGLACTQHPTHQRIAHHPVQMAAKATQACSRPSQPTAKGVRQAHRNRILPSFQLVVKR